MPLVLVTGATGFVGRAVVVHLLNEPDVTVHAAVRADAGDIVAYNERLQHIAIGDIGPDTKWGQCLTGVDTVIHAAARVHMMHENAPNPLEEFRRVNVDGTLELARDAAAASVRRFIYLSSIKVNGESTLLGYPYRPDDIPSPCDPYGLSKYEAEEGLRLISRETGLEVVIIRPVLVYGPGVKANFLSMMRWLDRGVPLPLGAIHNKRSLVSLDNLVDLIVACKDHPAAANETFLVSDGEDMSTTELVQRLGYALNRPARLIPVPETVITRIAKLLGKEDLARRLCGSLQVDISKTRQLLGWTPVISVDEALQQTARYFISIKSV